LGGKGEEMTQTLYAHMNKIKIKKKKRRLLSSRPAWANLARPYFKIQTKGLGV
jgi:hypothetical protein